MLTKCWVSAPDRALKAMRPPALLPDFDHDGRVHYPQCAFHGVLCHVDIEDLGPVADSGLLGRTLTETALEGNHHEM